MDEDVLLFCRLNQWYDSARKYHLVSQEEHEHDHEKQYDELVLKKDGQLIIASKHISHDCNKLVYL